MTLGFLRTRELSFLVGALLLFYFSLLGSWAIVFDRLGESSGFTYQYLEDKLFPVYLDAAYFDTIRFYGLFICLAVLPMVLMGIRGSSEKRKLLVVWRPEAGAFVSVLALGISFWIMKDYLYQAIFLNLSGYAATRGQLGVGSLFTLHQILNRVTLFTLVIGFVLMPKDRKHLFWLLFYGGFFIFTAGFCAVLGNKNELLQSFILGGLLWQFSQTKSRPLLMVGIGFLGIFILGIVNFIRTLPLSGIASGVSDVDLWMSFRSMFISNEAIGPHLALYNSLLHDIPPSGGTSIISLILSVVPRLFWPNRPGSIYEYYVEHLGVIDQQGFGIHHAAGWYLNFGLLGIIFGALILGFIWLISYRQWISIKSLASDRKSLILFFIYPAFCLFLVEAIRAGPEAYKGFFVSWSLLCLIGIGLLKKSPSVE